MAEEIVEHIHSQDRDSHHCFEVKDNAGDTFILARTTKEKSSFRYIQFALNKLNLDIRNIKQTHVLCVCSKDLWRSKETAYIEHSGLFHCLGSMTSNTDQKSFRNIWNNLSKQFIAIIHDLFLKRTITKKQHKRMMSFNQWTIFQINKLRFTPVWQQNQLLIQPMIKSHLGDPMKSVSNFVDHLLAPIVNRFIRSKSIISTGLQAIQAMDRYHREGHLQSSTFFVEIYMEDLYHTLSHDLMMESLGKFLHSYVPKKHLNKVGIKTILELVKLILDHQFCIYDHRLYHQRVGGSISSPLIVTLVDIYVFFLLSELFSNLTENHELFGRSSQEIFFTWNDSEESLDDLIGKINRLHSTTIDLLTITSMNHELDFLDAEITHQDNALSTRVYHDETLEPYTLPSILNTIHLSTPAFLLRAALVRAVLYCSDVYEFEIERLFIEISFLLNHEPLKSIQMIMKNFFLEFQMFTFDVSLNERTYQQLRRRVFHYQQQRCLFRD